MKVRGVIRNIVTRVSSSTPMIGVTDETATVRGQAASDLIKEALQSDNPSLICRFASNELNMLLGYCYTPSLVNYFHYVRSQLPTIGWSHATVSSFVNNAGFFPGNDQYLTRYAEMTLNDIKDIDILGTWM